MGTTPSYARFKKAVKISDKAIIQEVQFLAFLTRSTNKTCKHIRCGWKRPRWVCKKCGLRHSFLRGRCDRPSPDRTTYCNGKLEKVYGEPVPCKNQIFIAHDPHVKSADEIANPRSRFTHILIRCRVESWHVFVIDVKSAKFESGRYMYSQSAQKAIPVDADVDFDIVNQDDTIEAAIELAFGEE